MQSLNSVLQPTLNNKTKQYTVNKTNLNNSIQLNSKDITTVLGNLSDVIPDDGYTGFYVNQLKRLGTKKFCELANKARALNDNPARLFCWMLKNNEIVK